MSFQDPGRKQLTYLILFANEELVLNVDELLGVADQILVGLVNGHLVSALFHS